MKNKEGFVLYLGFYEPIRDLSDEDLGKLLRLIFEYHLNKSFSIPSDTPPAVKMAFQFLANQFRVDQDKYQKIVERNQTNGAKGGRPKKNPENPVGLQEPSGYFGNPKEKEKDKEKEKVLDKLLTSENITQASPYKENELSPTLRNQLWDELEKASAIEVEKQRRWGR